MYYNTNDYRDYLAHHGVLGQKWGEKNGPPYPLAYGNHSAMEKKAGWINSLKEAHRKHVVKKRRKTAEKLLKERVHTLKIEKEDKAARNKVEKEIHASKLSESEAKELREKDLQIRKDSIDALMDAKLSYDIGTQKYVKRFGDELVKDIETKTVTSHKIDKSLDKIRKLQMDNLKLDEKYLKLHRKNEKRFKADRRRTIKEQLSRAKNNDSYQMEFLEAIQNKSYFEGNDTRNKRKRLREYEKYLNDPENYKPSGKDL